MMQNQFEHRQAPKRDDLWDFLLSFDASNLEEDFELLKTVSLNPAMCKDAPPPITLVTDANAVFTELSYIRRGKEHPSAYREMSLAGVCDHHAPDWIKTELATSVIPRFSKQYGMHESETIDWVESQVMPLLEIHDGYSDVSNSEIAPHLDPKDAPFVILARDIDASGIVSNDRDIDAYGFRRLVFDDLSELLFMARCEHASAMTRTFGHFGGRVAVGATEGICKGTVKGFKALPPIGQGLVAVGGALALAVWLYNPKGRAQAQNILKQSGLGAMEFGKFAGSGAVRVKEWDARVRNIRTNYTPE